MKTSDAGVLQLDRRQFLKLAAATGLVAATSATSLRAALAQEDASLSEAADPVASAAALLEHDPERIFRFVQAEVGYQPYAGLLRGARGALLSRSGNSVDQALLLAGLLTASGVPFRFVTGPIDDAVIETLMATTRVDTGTAREQAAQALISDGDIAAGIHWNLPTTVPAEELAKLPTLVDLRADLEADRKAFEEVASRMLSETVETIMTALGSGGIELPLGPTGMPDLERDGHTWVQVNDGREWLDMDPSIPDVLPGQSVSVPGEPVEALPDGLRHRVEFTVMAETLLDGALAQEPILAYSGFADELMRQGIVFMHMPATGVLADVELITAGLSEGTRYNPLLLVGPNVHMGRRPISIGGGGGAAFVDAFGGGGGEGLVEGETSAEWLEVSVTSPGAEPVVARRTVFDRVGQITRESGVVDPYAILPAELVDLGDGVGAHFLPTRGLRAFSVTGGPLNVKDFVEGVARLNPSFASIIPGSYEAQLDQLAAALAASMSVRRFSSAPTIASLLLAATPDGNVEELDLWHRSYGSLGMAGTEPTVPPAMIAGVLPHVVERIAMGSIPRDGDPEAPSTSSVGAIFEAAAAQGIPTRLIAGSLDPDVTYGPEHRARIQAALDAGLVVVAPESAIDLGSGPRLGWWLIDPATGAATDQRDDGAGAASETTVVVAVSSFTAMAGQAAMHSFRVFQAQGGVVTTRMAQLYRTLTTLVDSLGG